MARTARDGRHVARRAHAARLGVLVAAAELVLQLGHVLLALHAPSAADDAEENARPLASLLLRRRSLNVYAGPAYSGLFHGIAQREQDVLDERVINLEAEDAPGEIIPRGRRWSVVFVHKLQR